MLEGCTAWPPEFAARYRAERYWEDRTLWQMLETTIARYGGREALVCGDQRITYNTLGLRIGRLAAALASSGLKPTERVVLQLPNLPEFVYTFFALVRIGVIPVMALPPHRHTEIKHFIGHSGATGYFIPDIYRRFDYRGMAAETMAGSDTLTQVFVAGTPGPGQTALAPMIERPAAGGADELLDRCAPDPGEVALMLLSGGTTALPKLIPRTHNDYVYNAKMAGAAAGFGDDTVFLAILPMAHNYTLACPGILAAFANGSRVVISPGIEPETVFPLIETEKVTLVSAALPLITSWLDSDVPERHDLSSLKVVQNGGARLAPVLRRRVEQRFDCICQEDFGTAEGLINLVRLDADDEIRFNSSGTPISPGDEIRVVDEDGNDVPDGAPGELIVRGPYTIRGYYNAPEINKTAFTEDGFYHMDDVVRRRDGYVYVEGRRTDLINRGGEKISCDEVEGYILAHPDVKGACLVAMPDEKYGERACAFVIPKPGRIVTFEGLVEFLKAERIAKFKFPERLEIVGEFPISPAGKILRRALRDRIRDEIATETANREG